MTIGMGSTRLAPKAQDHILAQAALFEEDFCIDWLVALTEARVSHILLVLEEGISQGWMIRNSPEAFAFRDIKKKQKLQERLTLEERMHLHKRIAELLIAELPDDKDKALTIAPYFLHASNDIEGCRWLARAGHIHRRTFQHEKALQFYSKALDDLSELPGEEADHLFIELAIQYSKISTARHDTHRILLILQDAMKRSERLNDSGCKALLEMHMAKTEWLRSQYQNAMGHFERGWSIAKTLGDPRILRSATTFSTFFLYWQGRFKEAVASYEKSVPDIEKTPHGRFNLFAALTVGVCYAQIGQITQGLGMMDAFRAQCAEVGDHYLEAQAECAMGAAMLDIHRIDEAILYLENSVIKKRSQHHNEWMKMMGKLMLSYAYFLKGNNKRSITFLKDFLQHSEKVHITLSHYPYLMMLYWAMEEGKLVRIPELSLEREIRRSMEGQNVFMKGMAFRYQALLQQRQGQAAEDILASLNSSLKWLEVSGNQVELSRSRLELARHYFSISEEKRAKEETMSACKVLSSLNEALIPDDFKSLVRNQLDDEGLLEEILKLSQEVITLRDYKDIVQRIFSAVNRITGAERGAIFLLDGNTTPPGLLLRASKNLTPEHIARPNFLSSIRMIEDVARTGQGRIFSPDSIPSLESVSSEVIRSCIGVPMILRDKVVGIMYHDNRLLRSAFKESDLKLLAYFAAQAAIALDNAQAYDKIRRLNQKLNEEKLYYKEENLQHLNFEDIVGEGPAIMSVLAQIEQVAGTDTNVLILGETGVGKELVARAIHRHSHRKDKPFIRVLCNALPESLIPSELFGHERGAFTGAIRRRIGRFELADGGTIFLDEIGELPMDIQVRLLRVLQTKEFERVGGAEPIHSDFRLITATNRDLEQEVKANRLRPDLFYRLNVFPIHVPPLRERKEDILLIAHHFLKIHSTKSGKFFERIPEEELEKLLRYDWPGNVRELENVIERATILNPGPTFLLPELVISSTPIPGVQTSTTLRDMEYHHILSVLQKTGWKVRGKRGAAELLNVHPSTLAYRMKRLGIKRPATLSLGNQ